MASSPYSTTQTPDLSIIIVSWNVKDLLHACLASLARERQDLALDVIVVDGDSHDGSADMVQRDYPWVHLIALETPQLSCQDPWPRYSTTSVPIPTSVPSVLAC